MTVKQLIKKLEQFDLNTNVIGEFDSDGDEFMVKVDIKKVYKGNGIDDSNWDEEEADKEYVIIQLNY
jgi:hypothetical protein